jgi:hypothetical protein
VPCPPWRSCSCDPSYEAQAWSATEARRVRKTFREEAEAKTWLRDARVALRRGREVRTTVPTLEQAGGAWLEQARAGVIRRKGGDRYKPATLREYERALRRRAYPALGSEPLDQITADDVQELVDRLVHDGLAATTVETTVNGLRVIYGRERVKVNPTRGVKLRPGGSGARGSPRPRRPAS